MPWVRDGLATTEQSGVELLIAVAIERPGLFDAIIGDPWVQDGIRFPDSGVIRRLDVIAQHSPSGIDAVFRLGILNPEDISLFTHMTALSSLAEFNTEVLESVLQSSWVEDGIEYYEWKIIGALGTVARVSPERASEIAGLSLLDTVEPEDADVVVDLQRLASERPALFNRVVRSGNLDAEGMKQWRIVSAALKRISGRYADQLAEMPFLRTIEPADLVMLQSLENIRRWGYGIDAVMNHPTVQDGITDDEAKVIVTLYGTMRYNPDLLDTLLDPSRVTVEERTIDLPLAGETLLTIIRIGPGSAESMNHLEYAVRTLEEFMDVPFPTNYVAYLFADAVSDPDDEFVAGSHFNSHITSKPDYDDGESSRHIAHEVAHYYWTGDLRWINEGGADFSSIIAEHTRTGSRVEVRRRTCAEFSIIKDIKRPADDDGPHTCDYRLGQRFFLDMYHTLGEVAFRQGFRGYHLSDTKGVAAMEAAFKDAAGPDAEHLVDLVLGRWYYGTEPQSATLDLSEPDPQLPAIKGRIDAFYVGRYSGAKISEVSLKDNIEWVCFHAEFTSGLAGAFEELLLDVEVYFEDGSVKQRTTITLDAYDKGSQGICIGVGEYTVPGTYYVFAYDGERKVAQAEYVVTP